MTEQRTQQTSLVDLLIILSSRKWLVLGPAFLLALGGFLYLPFLRDTFTAQAVILPPQQQQSSLAAFASGAMGGLGGGVGSQFGLRNPSELYIGILKSQTVSDDMVGRFQLKKVYRVKLSSVARRMLRAHTSFTSGKDSLLVISVRDSDPKRAAAMANAFIDELYKQNSRLALTDASQRRLFFQERLSKERDDLSDSEIALKNTQTETGLVVPGGQAQELIRSVAQVRAQISMREVSLQGIRSYATDDNAQVQILKQELSTLRAQLTQLEGKGQSASGLEISAGALPAASLAALRRIRDVKYHETLYELLSRQYEAALLDEARQAPLIQVVDSATIPDRRSGPRRRMIVLQCGLVGFVLGVFYVLIERYLKVFKRGGRLQLRAQ